MHYFRFNIGDYVTHTRHLSPIEDLAYRRLLDWYYLNERSIPADPQQAARLVMLSDYATAVEQVLNEFFTLTENGWTNSRADKEIARYKMQTALNSAAGKASAESRKAKKQANPERTLNGCATSVQPTNNQELITKNQKESKKHVEADGETYPPPVPKKSRKPSGDHQIFLAWWCFAYHKAFNEKYLINGGKDGKNASDILKAMPLKDAILKACAFFVSNDPFYNGKVDVAMFRSSINRLHVPENGTLAQLQRERVIPSDWSDVSTWLQGVTNGS